MRHPDSNRSPTVTTNSQRRYGSVPRQYGRRYAGSTRSGPPVLLSPETSDDSGTIDLRDTADRLQVVAELPDCSRDDVHVSKVGATLRIRADPSGETTETDETTEMDETDQTNQTDQTDEKSERIDRTITLGGALADSPMDVTYDEDRLRVVVPKPSRER